MSVINDQKNNASARQAFTSINAAIQAMLAALGPKQVYWVAYSGGVDSHVLLHALVQHVFYPLSVRAIHIHHGLHPEADAWQAHCVAQAAALGVVLDVVHVDAKPARGQSPEAAAREARYNAFSDVLELGSVLLTAHHQHDQAETLLLQLLRGAGVKGLAAMPQQAPFSGGLLFRPFLDVSRAAIEGYADQASLQWVEDPSNASTDFDRNFLRHAVLPVLAKRWPNYSSTLARSAGHCAEASVLLEEIAAQDLVTVLDVESFSVDIKSLLIMGISRQVNVLRHWIARQGLPAPATTHLACLFRDGVHAAADKMPLVQWPGVQVRRFRGRLFAMKPLEHFDISRQIEWDRGAPLVLPDNLGVLMPDDGRLQVVDGLVSSSAGPITIRFRQGGEKMRLPGREGQHDLKKLMQEWQVLPWRRNRVPLIYVEDKLVAVLVSAKDILAV